MAYCEQILTWREKVSWSSVSTSPLAGRMISLERRILFEPWNQENTKSKPCHRKPAERNTMLANNFEKLHTVTSPCCIRMKAHPRYTVCCYCPVGLQRVFTLKWFVTASEFSQYSGGRGEQVPSPRVWRDFPTLTQPGSSSLTPQQHCPVGVVFSLLRCSFRQINCLSGLSPTTTFFQGNFPFSTPCAQLPLY